MIPMHQAMSRKRTTILRMVSIKEVLTVGSIGLPLTYFSLMFRSAYQLLHTIAPVF